jgi:drug/metabolite transporter (DMT)-like permease
MTTATTATLLGNNAPVFVGLGTWLVFRRRPGSSFWIGLGLALAGCVAIVATDLFARHPSRPNHLTGDILALVASVFWAAYLLTTERVRESMDTLTFSTLAIAGSTITLLILCLALGIPLSGYPRNAWVWLIALGLFSQLAAYYCLVYALGHLPATITSVGLIAQVPLTALLAIPLLGEPITPMQLAGGALVLAGIYVVNTRQSGG